MCVLSGHCYIEIVVLWLSVYACVYHFISVYFFVLLRTVYFRALQQSLVEVLVTYFFVLLRTPVCFRGLQLGGSIGHTHGGFLCARDMSLLHPMSQLTT